MMSALATVAAIVAAVSVLGILLLARIALHDYRKAEGQRRAFAQAFGQAPPMHMNCRCTLARNLVRPGQPVNLDDHLEHLAAVDSFLKELEP